MANSIAHRRDSSGFTTSLYPTLKSASHITNETLALNANDVAFRPAALVPIPNPNGNQDDLRVFELTKPESIFGREAACDHPLGSIEISRKHAAIKFEQGCWWIVDLKSTNGILVQGNRLQPDQKAPLVDGYSVCFGPAEHGSLKYIFRENYSFAKMPCVPSFEMAFIDPNGYESSAPTQDLSRASPSHSCYQLDQYRSEINRLNTEKSMLDAQLKNQKVYNRAMSNDYRMAQRMLTETESKYEKKIANLDSKIKKYRTLIGQLRSSQPHTKSVISSDDESSNDRPCNGMNGEAVTNLMREMTCSICSEYLVSPTSLSCSHVFCLHCIDQWKQEYRSKYNSVSKGICPVCRKEVHCQTQVLAFENVIDLVLETVLNNQEKEDRRKLVEARKQQRIASSSANSPEPFSTPADLGSFLQQILNGFPRNRRSSIVITSDESDDENSDEQDDDVDGLVEISFHDNDQDSLVEVDLDLSDVEDYDISIMASSGGDNQNEHFDFELQGFEDGSSSDEILIEDDHDNSQSEDDVYNIIILSDSDDSVPASRQSNMNGNGIRRDRSAQLTSAVSNAGTAAHGSRRSHPYRRNGPGRGRNSANNINDSSNGRTTLRV